MKIKLTLLLLPLFIITGFFFSKGVMIQEQQYHQFIDQRTFFGIPNMMDVGSNIFFMLVGLWGLALLASKQQLSLRKPWFWFFLSVLLVAPGSAFYHWAPNDFTLIWDRLPMSIGFMALYITLLSEHIDESFERWLIPSVAIGLLSVVVWALTHDLRFYYIVQFSSFLTVPMILVLFNSRFTKKIYYFLALSFYALAKVTEVKDREIFEVSAGLMSGHTLKHILAAIGLALLCWMIKTRSESKSRTAS